MLNDLNSLNNLVTEFMKTIKCVHRLVTFDGSAISFVPRHIFYIFHAVILACMRLNISLTTAVETCDGPPYTVSDALSPALYWLLLCMAVMQLMGSILHNSFTIREISPRDAIMHTHSPIMPGLFTTFHDLFCHISSSVYQSRKELRVKVDFY